ncbi:MAG: hypothetical protein ACOY3P_00980 [Planctomycetota bacterium]
MSRGSRTADAPSPARHRRGGLRARLPSALLWLGVVAVVGLLALAWRAAASDARYSEQRTQIEQLPAAEQEKLRQLYLKFEAMSPQQRGRLIDLAAAIEADPEAKTLWVVLDRHHRWLQTIPSSTRSSLASQSVDERIAEIRKIQAEQEERRANRMSESDGKVVMAWLQSLVEKNTLQYSALVPSSRLEILENAPPEARTRFIVGMLAERWRWWDDEKLPAEVSRGLKDLLKQVSPGLREQLSGLSSREQLEWIGRAVTHILRDEMEKGGFTLGQPIDDETLIGFFEKELSPRERDWLMWLPGDQMQRALRRMYLMRMGLVGPGSIGEGFSPGPHGSGKRGGPPEFPGRGDWGRGRGPEGERGGPDFRPLREPFDKTPEDRGPLPPGDVPDQEPTSE